MWCVTQRFNHIAKTPDAPGIDAPGADDTDGQTNQIDGLSMADDDTALLERKRTEVHNAVEEFMKLAFPGVLVTTDWLLIAEDVMSDDAETRLLHPAVSATNTSWKILGMTAAAVRHFSQAEY